MGNLFTQDPSRMLEAFADALEGGNSYRGGGTALKGIPGLYSNDRGIRNGDDTPLTVVGTAVSATAFDVTGYSWDSRRWVPSTNRPPFFAVCTTSTGATSILNERRKITGYNDTTKVFTVSPALSATPVADDVFAIQEGFKRLPNGVDIREDDEAEDGYDRHFHLSAEPGDVLEHFGDNLMLYRTLLAVELRMLKFGRLHDWTAAVMRNLAVINTLLPDRDHYESTYTRALLPMESEFDTEEDKTKVIGILRLPLIYQIDGTAV